MASREPNAMGCSVKVVIAGSRNLVVSARVISDELARFEGVGSITEVVSGAAPGVDKCGEDFARYHRLGLRCFPANWERHGKAAGPIRNKEMAEYADAALVFCREQPTPGSSNMATWMLALGKPVRVVLVRVTLSMKEQLEML
jgi:hypothetical protein